MRLSENFREEEFLCRCCGAGHGRMHPQLIIGLQLLRDRVKAPLTVTSGFRCVEHNRAVGGVPNSYHTQGLAADVYTDGLTPYELAGQAALIPQFREGGIGIYRKAGFVHLDVGHKRRWTE